MAITNFKPRRAAIKADHIPSMMGNGAPASTDALVTEVANYPIGTEYWDNTNFKLYIRKAVTGATGDFVSTVALT